MSGTVRASYRRLVSRVVSVKRRWRGRVRPSRRYPGEGLDPSGTLQGVFLDRAHGHTPFGQSQRGGFVTKTHIHQCEITSQERIFRLFFEEKFQFAARLSPSFLGRGMLAGNFLRPA